MGVRGRAPCRGTRGQAAPGRASIGAWYVSIVYPMMQNQSAAIGKADLHHWIEMRSVSTFRRRASGVQGRPALGKVGILFASATVFQVFRVATRRSWKTVWTFRAKSAHLVLGSLLPTLLASMDKQWDEQRSSRIWPTRAARRYASLPSAISGRERSEPRWHQYRNSPMAKFTTNFAMCSVS